MDTVMEIIREIDDLQAFDEDEFINIACKKFIFSKTLITNLESEYEKNTPKPKERENKPSK